MGRHPAREASGEARALQREDAEASEVDQRADWSLTCVDVWSRLGSNQRPSACEADALPLSHGTGAEMANEVED